MWKNLKQNTDILATILTLKVIRDTIYIYFRDGGEKRLEITFRYKKEGKIFSNERLLNKKYGDDYKNIMKRMIELKAVNSLDEISTGPPPVRHKLSGNFAGCWAVRYSPHKRIVFKPVGEYDANDIKTIKKIEIVFVGGLSLEK